MFGVRKLATALIRRSFLRRPVLARGARINRESFEDPFFHTGTQLWTIRGSKLPPRVCTFSMHVRPLEPTLIHPEGVDGREARGKRGNAPPRDNEAPLQGALVRARER